MASHKDKKNEKESATEKRIDVEEIIELSEKFPVSYPKNITSMRCKFLVEKFGKEVIENNINSVYPVIHESALELYEKFLEMKRDVDIYRNMSVIDFVDRLLKKRAVSFLIKFEHATFFTEYVEEKESVNLPPHIKERNLSEDGTKQIYFSLGGWESIGTAKEKYPLIRENCLTYEEIELSSMLSVSSHTVFVNAGSRHNKAKFEEKRANIEDDGVIIGLIGPQFRKKDVMEFKTMVSYENVTSLSNLFHSALSAIRPVKDMSELMKTFYECSSPEILKVKDNLCFNVSAYKKRLAISFDTLLIEANSRAKTVDKKAFVHVVGIGLGVWKLFNAQNGIFIETFYERLEALLNNLNDVSDVRFAYIDVDESKKRKNIGGIGIHFENIDPHVRIGKDKLLVVSYAWDGNALPGNEFWHGNVNGSSDSAAGSSTQITELHNPHINTKVCGQNLRIATADKGIITYEEFLKIKQQ